MTTRFRQTLAERHCEGTAEIRSMHIMFDLVISLAAVRPNAFLVIPSQCVLHCMGPLEIDLWYEFPPSSECLPRGRRCGAAGNARQNTHQSEQSNG